MKNILRDKYGRNAQNSAVFRLLGIEGNRLPIEGLPKRTVQGFTVWVNPVDPADRARRYKPHRIIAQCDICGWLGSAGRTHQHKCKDI